MPSDISPYFGNKIARWVNGNAMPSPPSGLYMAFFNGNPKTTGVEVGADINSANPRQPVTFAAISSGVAHLLTSNIVVDWGNSEGETAFSHVGIFDAASAGNMLFSKIANGAPISVLPGSSVKFASGQVTINVGSDT
jgi:hypothetical protein